MHGITDRLCGLKTVREELRDIVSAAKIDSALLLNESAPPTEISVGGRRKGSRRQNLQQFPVIGRQIPIGMGGGGLHSHHGQITMDEASSIGRSVFTRLAAAGSESFEAVRRSATGAISVVAAKVLANAGDSFANADKTGWNANTTAKSENVIFFTIDPPQIEQTAKVHQTGQERCQP